MATIYAGPGITYGDGAGTEGDPFHIQEALENLNATDKTVVMLDGTYNVGGIFNNNQNLWTLPTSEGNRQTVQAESAGGVIWKPAGSTGLSFKQVCRYITFQDIIWDFSNMTGNESIGIFIFQQASPTTLHDVVFTGCTLRHAPRHNIYIDSQTHDFSLLNCVSHDAGRLTTTSLWNNIYWEGYNHVIRGNSTYYSQSHVKGTYGGNGGGLRLSTNSGFIAGSEAAPQSDGHLIEDNRVRGGSIGIVVSCDDHIIRNNEIIDVRYGTSNYAIEYLVLNVTKFGGGTTTNDNIQVYNNSVYHSSATGTGVAFVTFTGGTATNAKVKNNILRGLATATSFGGATVDTATNITTDPGFTDVASADPAVWDLHIAGSGNADGTGTDLSATGLTDDKDGLTRPQNGSTWCIGAYEVRNPPESSPINVMTWPTTGVVDAALSVTDCSVSDADDDLTGDADDNAGVWLRNDVGAVFSGTSTGTGTFQGEA